MNETNFVFTTEQITIVAGLLIVLVVLVGEMLIRWRREGKQPTLADVLAALPRLDTPYTRSGVEMLYESLNEADKAQARKFLEVLSPLTSLTPFDDESLVQWLKDRMKMTPAPAPESIPDQDASNVRD